MPARLSKLLYAGALLLAVGYLISYVALACARIAHPYELEWIEGPCVHLVDRILAGLPIYAEPSLDFIGPIYAPLYFYASAVLAKSLGVTFFPLRLLSFVASLGCFAILFALVRRETRCARCGLLAAGLFASFFHLAGAWYDLAHVDSLFLFLQLASALVLRCRPTASGAFFAAALGVLAFLAKQTAVPMIAALSLYGIYAGSGWSRWTYPLTAVLGLVISTVCFDAATDGWYWFYVFRIPGEGTMLKTPWWVMRFWTSDMPQVGIALAGAIYWLGHRALRLELDDLVFFGTLLLGILASCWSARIHAGGYLNVLMPAHAWVAVGASLAMHVLTHSSDRTSSVAAASAPVASAAAAVAAGCLAIGQLLIGAYDPRQQIPPKSDVAAGERIVERLRAMPGEVYVAYHPYLAAMAGKPWITHLELMNNLAPGTAARKKLESEIDDAVQKQRFSAIVTDRRKDRGFRRRLTPNMDERYEYRGSMVQNDELWPMTGLLTRAQDLYVARPADGIAKSP